MAWRTTSRLSVWSRLRRISATPKIPMASTAKSMPSARNGRPKVMRSSPVSRSVPTVESGTALAGHLVTIESRDHRSGLAGDVDEDRRGRAPVLGAVIDAGQHDERAGG